MKTIVSIGLLLLLMTSCDEEYEVPDTGRKLVVNGLITTNGVLGVNITKSLYITDSTRWLGAEVITNARILLYENSILVDSLFNISIWPSYPGLPTVMPNYSVETLIPTVGKTYEIHVKAPGFPDAFATTTIPNLVKIDYVDTAIVNVPKTEWDDGVRLRCDIAFTDPEDTQNYYMVYAFNSVDDGKRVSIPLRTSEPVVEEVLSGGSVDHGLAFFDKSINGQQKRISILLDVDDIGMPFIERNYPFDAPTKTALFFYLYSIDESYYKYIQTLNLFFKNYKNPFAQPVQVYSNVEGGYGMFTGAAVSVDSLVFNY